MLNKLLALILSVGVWMNPMAVGHRPLPVITSEVDRTEDGDFAVTLVYVDNGDRVDEYIFDIPQTEFRTWKNPGEDLEVDTAIGTFDDDTVLMIDLDGKEDWYYQFRSYDNEVWWCLTEDEIGFIPDSDKEYMIAYYQNETTKYNHECREEDECECYCYDDIFLGVYEL